MASLQKTGKNYGLIWTDKSRSPKQIRESLKTDVYHLAQRKQKQLEWDYHNGEHDPWKRKWYERENQFSPAISNLVESYIDYKAGKRGKGSWNETTAYNTSRVLRKFAEFSDMPIHQLEPSDIEDFLYRPSVNSDHTRRSYNKRIKAFLNWCVQQEYIPERPDYEAETPQSKVPKFLYPEELKTLIDWKLDHITWYTKRGDVPTYRAACWIPLGWMILAGTGMRPSELAKTKLSHIERGTITIGADYTAKTRRQRTVPLLYESAAAVHVLTEARDRNRYLSGSDYLMGRSPSRVAKELSREFRKAWDGCYPDRPRKTLYSLKDTFAVRFLCDDSLPSKEGLKLYDLMKILGHTKLETTQIYLRAIPYGTSVTGTIWTVSHG